MYLWVCSVTETTEIELPERISKPVSGHRHNTHNTHTQKCTLSCTLSKIPCAHYMHSTSDRINQRKISPGYYALRRVTHFRGGHNSFVMSVSCRCHAVTRQPQRRRPGFYDALGFFGVRRLTRVRLRHGSLYTILEQNTRKKNTKTTHTLAVWRSRISLQPAKSGLCGNL